MKKQKIKLRLASKYPNLNKKFKKAGMSKENTEELTFHLMEIEYSFDSIIENIDNILVARSKKKILDELEHIWSEFEFHVVNNHIIPAKKVLNKVLF